MSKKRKKIRSDYCAFAHECDKEHNCMAGHFCDAFELDEACATQVERPQRAVSVVDQFKKQIRFDSRG